MTPSTETQRMIAEAFDDFAKRLLSAGEQITASCAERIAINSREAARSASGVIDRPISELVTAGPFTASSLAAPAPAETTAPGYWARPQTDTLPGPQPVSAPADRSQMPMKLSDAQIKHMVDRFLGWKLPENFNPDGGIAFKALFNEHTPHPMKHEPSGTNLFDATQADTMVRYMLSGAPEPLSLHERANRELLTPESQAANRVPIGVSPAPVPTPPCAAQVPHSWRHSQLGGNRCRYCGVRVVENPPPEFGCDPNLSPAALALTDAAQGKALELLPCPFCGGRADYEQTEGALREVRWTVGCLENENSNNLCMAYQSLTTFATKREARLAWNTRSTPRAREGDAEQWEGSDAQERYDRGLILKRLKELHAMMPGNGVYAEGGADGSFMLSYHDMDADDNGRPVDRGGSLIEGEVVRDDANAKLLAEYLTLAIAFVDRAIAGRRMGTEGDATLIAAVDEFRKATAGKILGIPGAARRYNEANEALSIALTGGTKP